MKPYLIHSLIALLSLALAGVLSYAYAQDAAHVIEVHAKRFSFTPNEITIRKGETVTIKLISDDVEHSLVIPALNVNAPVKKGHPAEITITPETAGDFQGQCGHFCGSGHGRMIFTVHVKDS